MSFIDKGKSGVVFRVHVFTARDISLYSVLPGEKELLISPNCNNFSTCKPLTLQAKFIVTRALYTGEDGFSYIDLLEENGLCVF